MSFPFKIILPLFLRPCTKEALRIAGFALATLTLGTQLAQAQSPPEATATLGKGTHFAVLAAGKKTFSDVTVRQVTIRSILITDTDGLASIPLRELSPELQRAFGYNPAREAVADDRLRQAESNAAKAIARQRAEREASLNEAVTTKFTRLVASFEHPPVLLPSVDFRSRFREMSLGIKSQGTRASCAVFAIVSAYEFENAELLGKPEKLSEDYLIWATQQSFRGKPEANNETSDVNSLDVKDAGFSLGEVIAALRSFGIAPQSAMPDTFSKIEDIKAPSSELIKDSSDRRKLTIHYLHGESTPLRLENIVQALNEEVPVPIGLRWPAQRAIRTGYIDSQNPSAGLHAVTLVGYLCASGQIEDAVFLFKNSYGPSWGEAGYGRVSYRYLKENLLDAVVLEVRRPDIKSS